jgi:uncharacterized membrane protein
VSPPATPPGRILEWVAAGILLAMCVGAFIGCRSLPERIPIHFDLSGRPDGWGSRASVLFLPMVGVFVYVLMSVVVRIRPCYWNIPARVTPENAARVYGASMRLMQVVKVEAMALIGLITWLVVSSARADRTVGGWMPLVGAAVLVGTVAAGMVVVRRRARPSTRLSGGR